VIDKAALNAQQVLFCHYCQGHRTPQPMIGWGVFFSLLEILKVQKFSDTARTD
jgi:hypothetical protein